MNLGIFSTVIGALCAYRTEEQMTRATDAEIPKRADNGEQRQRQTADAHSRDHTRQWVGQRCMLRHEQIRC